MIDITKQARAVLRSVIEPVQGVDVVRLGLINHVEVDADGNCIVTMPESVWGNPLAESTGEEIARVLQRLDGVERVAIDMVWPPVRLVMKIREMLNW